MKAGGLSKKAELAKLLDISAQTLKNREDRGANSLDDIKLLCNKLGINIDWVLSGEGEMKLGSKWPDPSGGAATVEEAKYGYRNGIDSEIIEILNELDEDNRRDVLRYAKERKLLADMKEKAD